MEFREVPTRNLTYHVVECGLKEGTRGLSHRVLQFKESITHAQFGSYESQGITRSLRGQSRRTTQARIHLNHTIVLTLRIEGILHVTLTHDTDVTYNLNGQSPQFVVLRVRQCLRGSYHDTLTRMDAKGIEVLHVTHGNAVVVAVSYHLVFYLLPTLQTLLHQYLGRECEGFLSQFVQLLFIVAETRTQTSQRVGCTQNHRITQCLSSSARTLNILASLTFDGLHVDLVELLHKQLTILRIHDGLHGGSQYFHTVLLQHATLIQLHTAVQCRLSAKGQQNAVGALFLYHALHKVRLHWQEVNLVSHALRCLHRSDVRINQYRLYALFAQCFQGLRTTVVKLACLTDLQCSRSQQQYLLDAIIFHDLPFYFFTFSKRFNKSVEHKLRIYRT